MIPPVLPTPVRQCLDTLERSGYRCYAVGGCVRDAALGLIPHDFDLCTAATPEQMRQVFSRYDLVLAGEKHGTVGVITPEGVVEITTFRTEGDYRDNRHPDWVRFVTDIEADLSRRDFTVNAMAWSPVHGFADPFGGEKDLSAGVLRAVGDPRQRFREDSLRILRGLRFSVRYDLLIEENTLQAMEELAPLMDHLARERVFDELCKLLPIISAKKLLQFGKILSAVIPELAPTIGFDQHNPHHAFDLFTHIAHVTAAVPAELPLRWAALLHDVGKIRSFTVDQQGLGHFYGHAGIGADMADRILHRLKAPTSLRERVVLLIAQHMTIPHPERKALRRWLSRFGEEACKQLLSLQQADHCSKGVVCSDEAYFRQVASLMDEILAENACLTLKDLAVKGTDLMALGYQGPAIGKMLNLLLDMVLEEQIPNEKQALLKQVPPIVPSQEVTQ